MTKKRKNIAEKLKKYRFELRHLLVLFMILVIFQGLVSFINKMSLQKFLEKTQKRYQQESVERLANLSTNSLELVLEMAIEKPPIDEEESKKVIQAFNIIFSQHLLQKDVEGICLLIHNNNKIVAIDDGRILFNYIFHQSLPSIEQEVTYGTATFNYLNFHSQMKANEQIISTFEGEQTFHVFVPFVPKGEYVGAVYMKIIPNFTFITDEIIYSYNETNLIFIALIFFGLLAMFYISSYTIKERDEARQLLFEEREKKLMEQIHYQKEVLFTKRIYHTHHKAEKIMGFIKEDLRLLNNDNFDDIKYRVTKYANFISRVIYDMKWYDPPIQTIRNPIFQTNINEVIQFITKHIFLRLAHDSEMHKFNLDFDENLPTVSINEFVIWEIFEPIFQNCIDHANEEQIIVTVKTSYDQASNQSKISISDNGKGISPELLEKNEEGIKKIFLENISTKKDAPNSGYGCYLAYEISRQRCGWDLDIENLTDGGCQFIVTINH